MFVKYTPKVAHTKVIPLILLKGKNCTFDNDTVTLRPGVNELTAQEWEAIQPHIKDLIGNEINPFTVTVETKKGKPKKAGTLKDVPVSTARKIIDGCQDPKTLKKWFNQELPDELLLIISKRMRKLKIEPDTGADDAADLDLHDDDITTEEKTDTTKTDTATVDTGADDEGEDDGALSDDDDEEVPDFDGSGAAKKDKK